jgi:hypothetical protein
MGETRNWYRILIAEPHHLADIGVDGRIILKWILKKWGVGMSARFIWLRTQTSSWFQ